MTVVGQSMHTATACGCETTTGIRGIFSLLRLMEAGDYIAELLVGNSEWLSS